MTVAMNAMREEQWELAKASISRMKDIVKLKMKANNVVSWGAMLRFGIKPEISTRVYDSIKNKCSDTFVHL